ncbi:hypothetical protein [Williamsia sp. 1138]|uniref:hypothetical protein n=1 Tax=Williamsia sp. 1138 TaxID=1903117 RepID=UPI000A11829C|nr:hypothetical protein [Williamsia sp. 1138]
MKTLRGSARKVVALGALVGLLLGIVAALVFSAVQSPNYEAKAVVVMMPAPGVPVAETSYYWEILSRGQVTRTAAIVLADHNWMDDAAQAAGVPESDLTLTTGAVADTTLIELTMSAGSADAAEKSLTKLIEVASPDAAKISGPFVLKVISSPEGSAEKSGISSAQLVPAAAIAGLVLGAGIALLLTRIGGVGTAVSQAPAGPPVEPAPKPDPRVEPKPDSNLESKPEPDGGQDVSQKTSE